MQFNQSSSLFTMFFRSLFILLTATLIGLGIGWGASKLQTAQWKAVAKFDYPSVQQLGNYYALSSTYTFLQGDKNDDVEKKVFGEFLLNLNSNEVLKEFLSQNEQVKKYASDQKQLVEAVLPEFIQAFKLNGKYSKEMSVIWKNQEMPTALLSDYILYVTTKSRTILNGELITKWKVLFQQVKFSAENQLGAVLQGSQIAQQDWNGKLNLMKAVQPLDNSLVPFRLQQSAMLSPEPIYPSQSLWMKWGAFIGFLLALGFIGFARFGRKSV